MEVDQNYYKRSLQPKYLEKFQIPIIDPGKIRSTIQETKTQKKHKIKI